MFSTRHRLIARNIAALLLAGVWKPAPMTQRLLRSLGRTTRKAQRQLVLEVAAGHRGACPPSIDGLTLTVAGSASFEKVAAPMLRRRTPIRLVLRSPKFAPAARLAAVEVPPLATSGDIAAWLGLTIAELEWFTDERRQHGRTAIPDLQHYSYVFRAKAHGPPRLIEAPKPRLKTIQRRILASILDRVPVHDAAHGFVRGRSCLTGAQAHVGAALVIGFDIADFFVTTPLGRVHALFRHLGYPDAAARVLTRLCSTATPQSVFDRIPNPHRHTRGALRAYASPHLPQGAPTSPALANLVAYRVDVRLAGLAASFGGSYTRYADDMTFSGDAAFARKTRSLAEAVAEIVEDEGYRLNERKTRLMSPAHRQTVTGIVVNRHLNLPRDAYDALKATLYNCRRNGLDAENRDGHPDFRAHLAGRVGWVEGLNPVRGRKLRAMLDEIG